MSDASETKWTIRTASGAELREPVRANVDRWLA
jgi:hypothetical protein